MKKVLILTASFGDGHNAAAHSVREAVELLDDSAAVEVLDLLDAAYGRLNTLAKQAYLGMVRYTPALWGGVYHLLDSAPEFMTGGGWTRLRKALAEVIEQSRPDVIVSTYPVYGQAVRELYQDHADRGFRFCTIVTDSITVNAAWHRAPSDRFFVANDETAAVMRQAGVSPDLIEVTGFPVNPIFATENVPELEPPVAGQPARVLFIINTGRAKVGKTFDRLLEDPRLHLTVTAGRDPELKAKLVERARPYGDRVSVLGWTNQMPRLLMTHHFVITKAGGATVQEAIAARCPLIINQTIPGQEEGNARLVEQGGFGVVAEGKKETVEAVRDALAKDARRWLRWRENITRVSRPDAAFRIAEHILEDGDQPGRWRKTIPLFTPTRRPAPPLAADGSAPPAARAQRPLLCDFHTHTNYSDGRLTVAELVDFYGQHGFDCVCITDHLADPRRLIGKLSKLSRLTLNPAQLDEYFEVIRREAARAWRKYGLLVLAGLEFNKDGYTKKSSAHLLGIDLKAPISPALDLPETIAHIHAQGGLAVASHPHIMKSEWGKNTLYLWENQDTYAPLLDAWEIANRDNLFQPVGRKRLPFIANSDFHKPKHIYSWKTLLHCEKDPEAVKDCIRRNDGVAITVYRDGDGHRNRGRAGHNAEAAAKPRVELALAG